MFGQVLIEILYRWQHNGMAVLKSQHFIYCGNLFSYSPCLNHQTTRCCLGSIVTVLRARRPGAPFPAGSRNLSLFQNVHPVSCFDGCGGVLSTGVKQPRHEFDYAHRYIIELKNERSCTSTPSHPLFAFMACRGQLSLAPRMRNYKYHRKCEGC